MPTENTSLKNTAPAGDFYTTNGMVIRKVNDSSKMEVSSSRPFALWKKVVGVALLSTGLIYGGKRGALSANVLRGSTSLVEFVPSNTIKCTTATVKSMYKAPRFIKNLFPQNLHDVQVGEVGSLMKAKPYNTSFIGTISGSVIGTSNEHGVTCAKVDGHFCAYMIWCHKIMFKATICPDSKQNDSEKFGPQNSNHCDLHITTWRE